MQLVDVPVCCNGLDLCANTLTVKGAKACADATEPKPADQYNIFIVRTLTICAFFHPETCIMLYTHCNHHFIRHQSPVLVEFACACLICPAY